MNILKEKYLSKTETFIRNEFFKGEIDKHFTTYING